MSVNFIKRFLNGVEDSSENKQRFLPSYFHGKMWQLHCSEACVLCRNVIVSTTRTQSFYNMHINGYVPCSHNMKTKSGIHLENLNHYFFLIPLVHPVFKMTNQKAHYYISYSWYSPPITYENLGMHGWRTSTTYQQLLVLFLDSLKPWK